MTQEKIPPYSKVQVAKVVILLENWISSSEDSLSNEEARNSPNETRLDALQERIDHLSEAKEALEAIE